MSAEFAKGQRVLVRPAMFPMAVCPGKIISKGRRPGFYKVRYYYAGFYNQQFFAERLEAIDDFGAFYQADVVDILEKEL